MEDHTSENQIKLSKTEIIKGKIAVVVTSVKVVHFFLVPHLKKLSEFSLLFLSKADQYYLCRSFSIIILSVILLFLLYFSFHIDSDEKFLNPK